MKVLNLFCLLGLVVALNACNTVEGFGKDLKTAGDSIEKKAHNKVNGDS